MRKSELKDIIRECIEEIYLDEAGNPIKRKIDQVRWRHGRNTDPEYKYDFQGERPHTRQDQRYHDSQELKGIVGQAKYSRKYKGTKKPASRQPSIPRRKG